MFNTSLNNALTRANSADIALWSFPNFGAAVDISSQLSGFQPYEIPFNGYMIYAGAINNGVVSGVYYMGLEFGYAQNQYASPFYAVTKVIKGASVALPPPFFGYGNTKCWLVPCIGG